MKFAICDDVPQELRQMTAMFYGWWLFVNGAVFGAEYYFLSDYAAAPVRRKRDLLLYLCVNSVLTFCTLAFPLPGLLWELIHTAYLSSFSRLALKMNWTDVIAPATIIFTLSTLMDGLSAFVMRLLSVHVTSPRAGNLLQALLSALTAFFLFSAFRFIARRYREIASKEPLSYLYMLLLPCAFVVWIIRSGLGLDSEILFSSQAPLAAVPPLWAFSCIAGAFLTFFAVLKVFEKVVLLARQETEKAILAAQLQEHRAYLAEAASRVEQYRGFQHDINNHLLIVSGLFQAKKYDGVQRYFDKLNLISHALSSRVSTGNVVLDVLLNEKLRYAEQSNITVSCCIQLPKDFWVNDFDLSILFSNAIDNAIQACLQERGEYRRIELFSVK